MRTYDVTLADLPEQPVAVVRGRVAHDGIADFLGGAFGEVMQVLERRGSGPAGMPFGRYRPTDDGGWDIEAGFPVREPVTGEGRVEPDTLPAGHAARVLHRGPYDQLAGAYDAAMRWVTENGFRPTGDPWEMYLDGPEVPEPRTEVFVPCTEAHR